MSVVDHTAVRVGPAKVIRRMSHRRQGVSEQGFVLVTAIWLLALCAAVAMALMWIARERVQASRSRADDVQAASSLEGVVYDVLYDLLSRGDASQWSRNGASGDVDTDLGLVHIQITLESGRIDLNSVDLDVLDTGLRGLGYGAREREQISRSLLKLRAAKHRISSWAEAEQILASLQTAEPEQCLTDLFTFSGGTTRPEPAAAPQALADALGYLPAAQRAQVAPGQAVRIRASAASADRVEVVARVTGLLRGAYSIDSWRSNPACSV